MATIRYTDPSTAEVHHYDLFLGLNCDELHHVGTYPKPDGDGVLSLTFTDPTIQLVVGLKACSETECGHMSNLRFVPETSSTLGLLCGVLVLALIRRASNG